MARTTVTEREIGQDILYLSSNVCKMNLMVSVFPKDLELHTMLSEVGGK